MRWTNVKPFIAAINATEGPHCALLPQVEIPRHLYAELTAQSAELERWASRSQLLEAQKKQAHAETEVGELEVKLVEPINQQEQLGQRNKELEEENQRLREALEASKVVNLDLTRQISELPSQVSNAATPNTKQASHTGIGAG